MNAQRDIRDAPHIRPLRGRHAGYEDHREASEGWWAHKDSNLGPAD
jgi:hypothetical protein